MNSITSRIVFTAVALVLCTAATIGLIQYHDYTKDQVQRRGELLAYEIENVAAYLTDTINDASRDALLLAETPPIQGLIRAGKNGGVDPRDGSTEKVWKDRLAHIFTSLASTNPDYMQVRYISLADKGREILRINQDRDGIIRVPDQGLQQKDQHSYVSEAIKQKPNTVFISEINLNREFGEIQNPLAPVQRISTPIYAETGEPFGVVVINVNMNTVYSRLNEFIPSQTHFYLADQDGNYLVHPDPGKTFGFDLGAPYRVSDEFPKLFTELEARADGVFTSIAKLPSGKQIVHLQKLPYDNKYGGGGKYMIAVAMSPQNLLLADIHATRNNILLVTLAFAIAAGFLAFISARMIVKPLDDLTKAAKELEAGAFVEDIFRPRAGAGEVATLSNSFFSMAAVLRERQGILEEKEASIRSILDNARSPILTVSHSGVIESANPSTTQLFGFPNEHLVGSNLLDYVVQPDGSGNSQNIEVNWRSIQSAVSAGQEILARSKDGQSIPVYASVSEIEARGDKLYTVILTDITEQKKIDRLKSDLSEQKRLDKLKGEFISTVSHELRTPMTSIMGSLGLIRSGVFGAIPEKAVELLEMAQKNGERLVDLINDILDIEKIESGNFSVAISAHSVNKLLSDAKAANTGFAIKHDVSIAVTPLGEDVLVNVDDVRFAQIMANLLSNAIKYSPANSKVVVRAGQTADGVRIAVSDNGSGIPEQFQKQIFEKFTQADSSDTRAKEGTGLGLSISKALVELFGGKIAFDTKEGEGTTFHFDLPVYMQSAGNTLEEGAKPDTGLPTILIVEDDQDALFVLKKILDGMGDIITAVNYAEAEREIFSKAPDVVILDLQLPDKYGMELVHKFFGDADAASTLIIYSVEEVPSYRVPSGAQTLVKSKASNKELQYAVSSALKHAAVKNIRRSVGQ